MNRSKRIVSRLVGILHKNKDSKKNRQILLHWCYEINKIGGRNHQLYQV